MNHDSARSDQRMGRTVSSATRVGCCRASDLGTSSPRTICKVVSATRTTAAEVDWAATTCISPQRSKKGASASPSEACP